MQYQITSDNIDLSPSMTALAKEKFERVERRVVGYVPEDARFARIVLNSAPNEMFTVKANVNFGGKEYFSDETDYSLESAMVKTVEELIQMMEKEKEIKLSKNESLADELLQEDDSAVE
jgi:ribosome-associated translation inhibitor RaiA